MIVRALLILLCLVPATALGEAPAAVGPPFHLPLPEGWRSETIPFPLDFAPGLEYEGLEELRFAPGMFKAEAEDFWSYAFVWWIPQNTPIDAKRLARDLEAYFSGLAYAVLEDRKFDPADARHEVEVHAVEPTADSPAEYVGTAEVFDSFVTLEQITLNLRVTRTQCPKVGYQAVVFELSPQAKTHAIWEAMAAIREGFDCDEK